MKIAFRPGGVALVLLWLAAEPLPVASADPGLLLVAHGSPRAEWNQPVLEVGRRVAVEVLKAGRFKAVRTAMLEAAEPSIPTAVAELEAEGCDRIVAVPLFIAPSGHSLFDVPTMLGLHSSPRQLAALRAEGATPATSKVPILLTQTLDEGDLLASYVLEQVRELSRSPGEEAVVVLAHGDPDHQPAVDRILREATTRSCGEVGIRYGDWACIGMGQGYASEGVAAINRAAARKPRVLVVGLYLSSTARDLHERALHSIHQRSPGLDPFHGADVAFSTRRLTDDPALVRWVIEAANAAFDPISEVVRTPAERAAR